MVKKQAIPNTKIVIDLPGEGGLIRTGTLIVQRGNLAQLSQFEYQSIGDIAEAIREATSKIVDLDLPDITMTDAEEYQPDIEARKPLLTVGRFVRLPNGDEGEIVRIEQDQYLVDIGKLIVGVFFRAEDIAPLHHRDDPPVETSALDPATVPAQTLPDDRPATDVVDTQLALF